MDSIKTGRFFIFKKKKIHPQFSVWLYEIELECQDSEGQLQPEVNGSLAAAFFKCYPMEVDVVENVSPSEVMWASFKCCKWQL